MSNDDFLKCCTYVSSTIAYKVGIYDVKIITDNLDFLDAKVVTEILLAIGTRQGYPIADVKQYIYRKFGLKVTITTSMFIPIVQGRQCAKCGGTKLI